jgi:hypothetical protein
MKLERNEQPDHTPESEAFASWLIDVGSGCGLLADNSITLLLRCIVAILLNPSSQQYILQLKMPVTLINIFSSVPSSQVRMMMWMSLMPAL